MESLRGVENYGYENIADVCNSLYVVQNTRDCFNMFPVILYDCETSWSTSEQQSKRVTSRYQGEMHGYMECDNFRAEELRFWEISLFLTVINIDKDFM